MNASGQPASWWAGSAWLLVALPPSRAMTYAQLGWWLGHFLELGGIIQIGTAVACDLLRGARSRPLAGALRVAEIVAQEEELLGARVRAPMACGRRLRPRTGSSTSCRLLPDRHSAEPPGHQASTPQPHNAYTTATNTSDRGG